MARTEKGARILMERDWNMMPLEKDTEANVNQRAAREPRTDRYNGTMYSIQGPYTNGVDDLVKDEEKIAMEKKWTDVPTEDKGLTVEEAYKLSYDERPEFVCTCRDAEGKDEMRYFFTLSGVIRHAWILRINQRTVFVSALDG
jgi:hypothetical protein